MFSLVSYGFHLFFTTLCYSFYLLYTICFLVMQQQLVEIAVERSILESNIQKSITRSLQLKKYYVIFKNRNM